MEFPKLSVAERHAMLDLARCRERVPVVIDTDCANEVDDPFAIAWAAKVPQQAELLALYAAPFHNERSDSSADGMEKSYQQILELLVLMGRQNEIPVYRGATDPLPADAAAPSDNAASRDLIARSQGYSPEHPLYVVAIGAATNIASALLLDPSLVRRMVLVWLGGGMPPYWSPKEFNLMGDPAAARLIFDSGLPVVWVPALPVTSHLTVSLAQLERDLAGANALCDWLVRIIHDWPAHHGGDHFGYAKEIWDIGGTACVIDPRLVSSHLEPTPYLTNELTWSFDPNRHAIRLVTHVWRNDTFKACFEALRG